MAPPSSHMSPIPSADFQTDAAIPKGSILDPRLSHPSSSASSVVSDSSLLDFLQPPDLFTPLPHCLTSQEELYFTLPREMGRNRPNKRHQFRGHSSHSSPLFNLNPGRHFVSPFPSLPTVASEPTLITNSESYTSPQGSHLPHFPHSPYKHPSPPHDTVQTQCPVRSSSLIPAPPPLPPCPTAPAGGLAAAAWGCCCSSFGDAATPLSRYLEKVGNAAMPLLKAGGLLKTKPSDVQT